MDSDNYPILIIGCTGTGKSTSLMNLNPESTCVLNTDGKPLPFKGYKKFKSLRVKSTTQMIRGIEAAEKNNSIETIVIDSLSMYSDIICKLDIINQDSDKYAGWGKLQDHIIEIFNYIKTSKKTYIVTCLEDVMQDNEKRLINVAKIKGGLKGSIETHFSIVLRSMTIDDINSKNGIKYVFATNKIPGSVISAKTPIGMYDDIYIDNDIRNVIKKVKEYYNDDETEESIVNTNTSTKTKSNTNSTNKTKEI